MPETKRPRFTPSPVAAACMKRCRAILDPNRARVISREHMVKIYAELALPRGVSAPDLFPPQ